MDRVKALEQLLDENLKKAGNSFSEELIDNCWFNKNKFNDLTTSLFDLHQSNLLHEQRLYLAIKLWELSFLISRALRCHYDSRDIYKIENLAGDDARQIDSILYYLCNWFSYNKKIEERHLRFGSW